MLDNCITTTVGKIFSIMDRQRILNIRNFLASRTLVWRVFGKGMSVCDTRGLWSKPQTQGKIKMGAIDAAALGPFEK